MQQIVIPVPPIPPGPGGPAGSVSPEFATQVLRTEMAVLRKELNDLAAQLVPGMTPAREEAISEQISSTQERLESLQEQLDRTLSGQPLITYTEEPDRGPAIPDEVMQVIEWGMITLVIIALGTPIVRTLARWLEGRGRTGPGAASTQRFDRLEQAVDAVAIEVERISEGQRYTNRMISEMRGLPAPNPLEQWPQGTAREDVAARRTDR
jgi:hypothetical protein